MRLFCGVIKTVVKDAKNNEQKRFFGKTKELLERNQVLLLVLYCSSIPDSKKMLKAQIDAAWKREQVKYIVAGEDSASIHIDYKRILR